VVDVLTNTEPAAAASGPSKAKYKLADGTAERVHAAAAELLAANPLYPGLTL
jgi:glycine hydroxymethyltransferase